MENKRTFRLVITDAQTGEVHYDITSDCILCVANNIDNVKCTHGITAIAANSRTILDTISAFDDLSQNVMTSSPNIMAAALLDVLERDPKAVLDGFEKVMGKNRDEQSDSENKFSVSDEEKERLMAHFAGKL